MLDHNSAYEQIKKTNEEKKENEKVRAKGRAKKIKIVISTFLIIILWAGIVYGGYHYGKQYLRQTEQRFTDQLETLVDENKKIEAGIKGTMQAFDDQLVSSNQDLLQIRNELNIIQEELALTGETITGSDETRLSLQERISELDRQLASLKEQLEKLEEAVRAF